MPEEKTGIVQGFKDFVMRGNVIDLAVAVVVGTAFAAVVKAVIDNLVTPLVAALGGSGSIGLGFSVNGQFVNIGAVIGAIITFLITMLVIYFVFVVPMNKARELSRKEPATEDVPDDVLLLREIRDLLATRGDGTPPSGGSTIN
jgi:large conductance mechanosensitive channel